MTFVISGDVDIEITVSETAKGDLDMTLSVLNDDGAAGDIKNVSFDFADPDLLDGLIAKGANISKSSPNENAFDNPGKGPGFKGGKTNDPEAQDVSVKLGPAGRGSDEPDETSFTLSHPQFDLSLLDIEAMDFTVVLEDAEASDASVTIGGSAPAATEMDEPPQEQPPAEDATQDAPPQAEVLEDETQVDYGDLGTGLDGAVTGDDDLLLLDPLTEEQQADFDTPEDPFQDPLEVA
ncbi:hypothetical protein ILP92_03910 [Maribius pontilimi]|uniref:Uncharacterized protein n=1 Tax=Palleronia pontilimi TaxID=1964209 RepID=A0A934IEX0_9RHOB|nr:hypothetical protein [Palleronia pontilimi]MBJ3761892.1 hypothetical protein [Palleronia pontilimi]